MDRTDGPAPLLGFSHVSMSVRDKPYGSVLCFKDPDRIQLELFYRDDHPEARGRGRRGLTP